MEKCPYCDRPLAGGQLCPAHGNVGPGASASADSTAGASIPPGGIILWSGSVASIPSGWALCDGSNGTPNLVDRFIRGAGASSPAVGASGGSNAGHTHSGGTTEMSGGHSHGTQTGYESSYPYGTQFQSGTSGYVAGQGHTHSISADGSHNHAQGATGAESTFPVAYYALAYIMRL